MYFAEQISCIYHYSFSFTSSVFLEKSLQKIPTASRPQVVFKEEAHNLGESPVSTRRTCGIEALNLKFEIQRFVDVHSAYGHTLITGER